MKSESSRRKLLPSLDQSPRAIKKAAAADGIRCHVVNVREARNQFSRLVSRAAAGEEIVITRHGRPEAMIVRPRPAAIGSKWISLEASRQTMPMGPDSGPLLDEIRADQI